MSKQDTELLDLLIESESINQADRALRLKIENIELTIQALQNKKLNLEREIKKQRKSLLRKREELKRVSKRNRKAVSESEISIPLEETISSRDILKELISYDDKLFQRSDRILDEDF